MSSFEVYKDYIALKNHFTKKEYDYIKYNGKTGVKAASFAKRKDKIFFDKLAKNQDYHEFLIANLSDNPKLWIRDLAYSDDAQLKFQTWKKRNQSLSYIFKQETNEHLCKPFNYNFVCKDGEHPILLKLYLRNAICLETFCVILDLTESIPFFDRKMEYDPVWEEISLKAKKYIPFIKYDKDKFRKILLDFYG
jgi:hypothetical protein